LKSSGFSWHLKTFSASGPPAHLARRALNFTGHSSVPRPTFVRSVAPVVVRHRSPAPAGLLTRTFCSIGRSLVSFSMFVSH